MATLTAACLRPQTAGARPPGAAPAAAAWPTRRAACTLLPRPLRRRGAAARATDGSSGSSGSGGSGGGGRSSEAEALRLRELAEVMEATIAEFDKSVEQQVATVEDGDRQLSELDAQIRDMKADSYMPSWAFGMMGWSRRQTEKVVEENRRRARLLRERRADFVAGVRALEAELRRTPPLTEPNESSADWMALAGYTWAQQEGDDATPEKLRIMLQEAIEQTSGPGAVMWSGVLSSMVSSWTAAWVASWFGVDAYRLLHELPDAATAGPVWLAWTAPFVGATLGAYLVNPSAVTKCALRPLASDQSSFYRRIPAPLYVTAAFIIGYCQCLTYQGMWQEAITGWLGGSRDPLLLTDAASIEAGVRQSMGSLVATPALPAFLLAPAAGVLTGCLEGAYYFLAVSLRETQIIDISGDGRLDVATSGPWGKIEPGALTAQELPLVALRAAVAGTYLALEATLTGSLWLAAGTSAAGITTAILLNLKDSGGSGSGGGSGGR